MSRTDFMREYMRGYRKGESYAGQREQRNATRRDSYRRNKQPSSIRPFVAVDGEGGNLPNGYHAYFLLRAGDRTLLPSGDNVRLTTRDCLEFLSALPTNVIYVAYFFDYDVTKIVEDLPFRKLQRLMDRGSRQSELKSGGKPAGLFPVDWAEFQIDYLPRKEFKVRKQTGVTIDEKTGEPKKTFSSWVVINDVGSFFQTKFVDAIEKWKVGTSETREAIGAGKELRAEFTPEGIASIDAYNALEIEALEELMEKFRAACIDVGYIPKKWQGPGQLAEAAFRKHEIPESRTIELFQNPRFRGLLEFALNAFYGGRPEISAIGPVDVPVFQWDINSAYPAAMAHLPCLIHGTWIHSYPHSEDIPTVDWETNEGFAICYGRFFGVGDNRTLWYGLPVRSFEGSISYPISGKGWYWNFEVAAGSKHQRFIVEEQWEYVRNCDCSPMDFVPDLYLLRIKLGKDGAGIVLKLLLNSLYGKTVQSIGFPKYSNPIWGSFITAYCRSMILQFIHSSTCCEDSSKMCGTDILMVATDSVCTLTERSDIADTKDLGGWSLEIHPFGMFLIQPGVYFGSSGKPAKTRGVPASVFVNERDAFEEAFRDMVLSHDLENAFVSVPQRMFVGIRLALQRHNLKLLGQWIEFEDKVTGRKGKAIRFDWRTKRLDNPALAPVPGVRSYILTLPKPGDPTLDTVPYSKNIGQLIVNEEDRAVFEAQPDWVELWENPG